MLDADTGHKVSDLSESKSSEVAQITMQDILREAVYQITPDIFPMQAGITLSNFYPVMEQLRLAMEIREGDIKSLKQDEKMLLSTFCHLAPTSVILIERLLGEPIDGGAKLALSSAKRSIEFIESVLQKDSILDKYQINEVRMGGDFLKLGLNMLSVEYYHE